MIRTYDELAQKAIREIEMVLKMNDLSSLTQVCGPISTGGLGSRDANLERFQLVKNILTQEGYALFDQQPYEEEMLHIKKQRKNAGLHDGYDMALLEEFYGAIFASGFVTQFIFIPGYSSSTGACWESNQAQQLGLSRKLLDEAWLEHYANNQSLLFTDNWEE